MKQLFLTGLFCAYSLILSAQVQFTSSNLPIIKISTNGAEVNRDEKVLATIEVLAKEPGQRNLVTDEPNDYNGNCGIKIRGESSSFFSKKSYAIELWDDNLMDLDTSMLGYPSEEDFILYGPYSDKSLVNNVLTMHLAQEMGQYASRTRYVELLLNGEYMGLYVLMEKIKRDKGRVDISKLRPEDNEGDELTGGYIVRIDKGSYDGWYSREPHFGNNDKPYFQFYYPDQEDITDPQKDYIETYMHAFEAAANSANYKNDEGVHYTEYVNLRSFVDHFIISELSKNADAYRLSTYFHKQKDSKGGRLFMGPVWDYNLSYGNADYCSTEFVDDFLYYECVGNSPAWWDNLLQDDTFGAALRCRYEALREGLLSNENLNMVLDSLQLELAEAQARNFQRWDIMGQYIWPNPDYFAEAESHEEIMVVLRLWLDGRLSWLDEHIPGIAADCAQYEDPDFIFNPSPTSEIIKKNPVKIFPNPTADQVRLRCEEKIKRVNIYDYSSKSVKTIQSSMRQVDMQLDLPAGMYHIEIVCEETTYQRILVVQ